MINRLIFSLSLVGLIVTTHLWVQKARHFDQGCWGTGVGEIGQAMIDPGGCHNPAFARYDQILGVPVALVGYVFYFAIASLSFAKIIASGAMRLRITGTSELLVASGIPPIIYFIALQAFVIKEFCPLCVLSSILYISIVLLHVWQRKAIDQINCVSDPTLEIARMCGIGLLGAGVLVFILVFVDQVGIRRLDQGVAAQQIAAVVATLNNSNPKRPMGGSKVQEISEDEWLTSGVPTLGGASGPTIIAFLDPNCPHCDGTFASLMSVSAKYKDTIRVAVLPRVLWDFSVQQVEALEIAKKYNKYYDLWDLQFKNKKRGGMSLKDITALLHELGIKAENMETRLDAERKAVLAMRTRASKAGINSTPAVFLNGKRLLVRSTADLEVAIDAALKP